MKYNSFYEEAEGVPSFGRDLNQSLAGLEPKGQKKTSYDKTEVNKYDLIYVADVDNCDKEQEEQSPRTAGDFVRVRIGD